MSLDHWLIFLGGVIAGALSVHVVHFIEEILEGGSAWDWYDEHEHLTGVEARRRLFTDKGDQ